MAERVKILVLNAGSSSQKSCLYELGESLPESPPDPVWEAHLEWKAASRTAQLKVQSAQGEPMDEELDINSQPAAIRQMLATLCDGPNQVLKDFSEVDVSVIAWFTEERNAAIPLW
jgi:acetate kinase